MRSPTPRSARASLATLAATGLVLVATVLLASATIRLGTSLDDETLAMLRVLHRGAATLEVLAAAGVLWMAWRRHAAEIALVRAAGIAATFTVLLAVVGVIAGRQPPPAAAMTNLLGGLALAACFAWILGRVGSGAAGRGPDRRVAWLIALQCALGAWTAIVAAELWSAAFFGHALLGLTLAWGAARAALARRHPAALVVALAVALSGLASALLGQPFFVSLAHAVAAGAFVLLAVHALARIA